MPDYVTEPPEDGSYYAGGVPSSLEPVSEADVLAAAQEKAKKSKPSDDAKSEG